MAEGRPVQLYIYDLTQGMARSLSPMLLGKQIDGVWHTGLVVDGIEYFFGHGIHKTRAGTTMFGTPYRTLLIGHTEVPHDMLHDLLRDMAPRYRPQDYSLLFHNCNTFSNELALLLTGQGIPEYILAQAQEVLNTPMGQMLMPMLMQMEGALGSAGAEEWDAPEEPQQQPAAAAAAPGGGGAPVTVQSVTVSVASSTPGAAGQEQVAASNVIRTSSVGADGQVASTTTETSISAQRTQQGTDVAAIVVEESVGGAVDAAADGIQELQIGDGVQREVQ